MRINPKKRSLIQKFRMPVVLFKMCSFSLTKEVINVNKMELEDDYGTCNPASRIWRS